MVVICIPMFLVKLNIFSYVYWSFRFHFCSIGLFLFLMNCRRSLCILNILNTNFLSVICSAEIFFQACCMISNLIYGIFKCCFFSLFF